MKNSTHKTKNSAILTRLEFQESINASNTLKGARFFELSGLIQQGANKATSPVLSLLHGETLKRWTFCLLVEEYRFLLHGSNIGHSFKSSTFIRVKTFLEMQLSFMFNAE